jgi:hypothetical protein
MVKLTIGNVLELKRDLIIMGCKELRRKIKKDYGVSVNGDLLKEIIGKQDYMKLYEIISGDVVKRIYIPPEASIGGSETEEKSSVISSIIVDK